jgi:hypothetical protein
VLVGFTAAGVRYLRRHGHDRGFATVPLQGDTLSVSHSLTLLAPR